MSPPSTLPITASNGQPLANRFFRRSQPTNHLALVLPGIAYNADMPLIYHTTQVLQFHGAGVLQLRPDYQDPAFQKAPIEGRLAWMAYDTRAGLEAGLAAGSGDKTFDPQAMQHVQDGTAAQVWIAEGADHSLEIPGDPLQSLSLLLAGMQALSTFLAEVL